MKNCLSLSSLLISLFLGMAAHAKQPPTPVGDPGAPSVSNPVASGVVAPRLVKFSGTLKDPTGQPLTGVLGVTFALYKDQQGGAPLWLETQNVQADAQGNYTVLLGATKSEGMALELFSTGESRWLGVQSQLQGETEQPRVLLVSVPYALKAADADTVGGMPASAFVLAQPAGSATSSFRTAAVQPSDAANISGRQTFYQPANTSVNGPVTPNLLAKWDDTSGLLGAVPMRRKCERARSRRCSAPRGTCPQTDLR